ncbi:MAG: AAA family ATPase [Planctomycetaceae bacterium]
MHRPLMNSNTPQSPNGQFTPPVNGFPVTGTVTSTSPVQRISSRPSGSPSPGGNGTDRPVTFWGILDAFRRRWIPTLAVAIPAAALVGALMWQTVPAEYESSALLKIEQFAQTVVAETKEKSSEFLTYRDSQMNYMKSRPVLTSALRMDGIKETRLLRGMKYPVEWLEEELEVESDFSPEFVRITLAGEFPEDLAAVVNAVKDVYLDEVVYNERNERVKTLQKMKSDFKELDELVTKNEDRIDRLAEELGTGDSKAAVQSQDLLHQQLRELQSELRDINADIREEEALRAYLKERGMSPDQMASALPNIGLGSSKSPLPVTPTAADPASLMQRHLMQVQFQIRQFMAASRNMNHPDLLALRQQERELKAQLNGSRTDIPGGPSVSMSRYEYLTKQKLKLESEMQAARERSELLGEKLIELEREKERIVIMADSRKEMAREIQNRILELEAPQRVSVVQEANVPEKRNVKARTQAAFLGGFGTLFVVIAGFTMYEWFSHRVGSTSDIANAVNLRLIGAIPSPDKGGLLGLGIFAGKVDYDEWNRAVIESMDVVRTYLMRHIDPSRSASILITSASANEGKTTVSCQLAASLARSGKRVAIVDCDFRRPSAHIMMDGQEGPGICEYLRGEASLKDVCQATSADGLDFIAAGQIDHTVLQKLSADGGRSLIDMLKSNFDFVVIDTSPLLFVAEPSMLAQNADIVLLSTRKDYSRIPYVAQSRDSLRSLQVPLLGAVMVGSDSDFQRQTYGYRQEIQRSTKQRSMVNS